LEPCSLSFNSRQTANEQQRAENSRGQTPDNRQQEKNRQQRQRSDNDRENETRNRRRQTTRIRDRQQKQTTETETIIDNRGNREQKTDNRERII
jgi:hypothetical protein